MLLSEKLKCRVANLFKTYFNKRGGYLHRRVIAAIPKLIESILDAKEIIVFVSNASDFHLTELHNADFEVCKHFVCKFAFWCEANLLAGRESARRAYTIVYGKNITT